ncbi:unnamed protein product [Rhizoctonia solani]|nr:unnamed protein product [Rhizoctonia solani]
MAAPTGRFAGSAPYARNVSPAVSTTDLLEHEKPHAALLSPATAGSLLPPMSPDSRRGSVSTLADKYSLAPDPRQWGSGISLQDREADDDLHNPDPRRDHRIDRGGTICTGRGILNLGCLFILSSGLLMLFAGYPILSYFLTKQPVTLGGYNLGGINATGQVPEMIGNFGLIDPTTPKEAYTRSSLEDGSEWDLVFSDEFNTAGRSFYPGDDPYWEASDLHYWGTNNLEWYDPSALTTVDGNLRVSLSKSTPKYHELDYMGGMMSTWNKFCFTGANVSLPGSTKAFGLWPAIWAMGNLGRAGYGASLDGTWPYTYDTCDVGTLGNQSFTDTTPPGAHRDGDPSKNGELSYLPGQRLSACTCKGESHPGPKRADGTFVGRAAPEIDMFEAQVSGDYIGHVSQSGQWAPFNYHYEWFNTTENIKIYNASECYSAGGGCFSVYGFEYKPGYDGYITWVNDGQPSWTIRGAGMGPDPRVELTGGRPVPVEPMYLIVNLGISPNFGAIDWENLIFPAYMLVDWIRVYQPKDAHNIGCDPPDFPTREYINTFIEAYTNPNLTTWVDDYGQVNPKNRLVDKLKTTTRLDGGVAPLAMHARISTSPGPSTFNKPRNYKLPSSPVPNYDVLAPDSYATAIGGRQARRRVGSTDDVGPAPAKSGLRVRSRSHSTHGNGNDQTHPLQANGSDRGADTRPVLRRMLSSKDGKGKGNMWGFSDGWVEEEDEEEAQKEVRPTGGSREMLVHKIQPKDSLAGVALRYGVSIADIRKANKLWAADSIHLRSVLYIPLTASMKLDLIDLSTPNQERDLLLPSDKASPTNDDAKSNASDPPTPAPDPDKPTIQHVPLSQLSFFPPPSMSPRKARTMPRSVSSPFASNPPLLFTPGLSSASLMSSPLFSTSSPQLSSSPNKGVGLSSLLSALPLPDAVQRLSIDSIAGGALTPRTASTPDISEQFVELNPMGTRSGPAGSRPKRTIKTQPTHGPVMTVPGRSVETGNEGRTTFATVDDDW